jgi:hypothetical protein
LREAYGGLVPQSNENHGLVMLETVVLSPHLRDELRFTWLHLKILTAIVCCRTSALGGHNRDQRFAAVYFGEW